MGTNTKKKVFLAMAKKAYFEYWRFQNNPDYVSFFEQWAEYESKRFDPPKKPIESMEEYVERVKGLFKEVHRDEKKLSWGSQKRERFGLGDKLVDPFKKINWEDLKNPKNIDRQIWDTIVDERKKRGSYPIKSIFLPNQFDDLSFVRDTDLIPVIDISFDKKEILAAISSLIDQYKWRWGEATNFNYLKRPGRDTNKLDLYAQVWDLSKGFHPKRTFREIARELKRPTRTIESQFKRAYELLFNKPYESIELKAIQRSLIRKTTCKDCPKRSECKIPCSDVLIQLEGIEVKQAHKLDRAYIDRSGKKRSTYERALERESVRKWREQSN